MTLLGIRNRLGVMRRLVPLTRITLVTSSSSSSSSSSSLTSSDSSSSSSAPTKLTSPPLMPVDPSDPPLSSNDALVHTHIRNRNPMNLERMAIGYKPSGFPLEKGRRNFWNRLTFSTSSSHTSAFVTHWTGRPVCKASTREMAIAKLLYSNTDGSAVDAVGRVLGQRCLETGVLEVCVDLKGDAEKNERLSIFLNALRSTGLNLRERQPYSQSQPLTKPFEKPQFKPWEIIDE